MPPYPLPQCRVTLGREDGKVAVDNPEQRHVKGAAAKAKDENLLRGAEVVVVYVCVCACVCVCVLCAVQSNVR